MRLREWQKHELRKIYDNPHGTRMAIISFGKKNAKTTLAAFLLLLHLAGPESVANTQLPSTAQSKEQAAVLFELAAKVVRMSPTLSPEIVIRDHKKQLYCPYMGTLYRALSADAETAHGQSPIFAVHDELGQVRGPRSELFNAIENAMGAHDAPMSIVISTQAPTDADLLSILIDDALAGHDPRIVVSLYTADPHIDPFSEEAIRQANPAFGDFLNAQEVLSQAERARRMPAEEPLYRNYTLNQRVEATAPFVTKSVWEENGGTIAPGPTAYGGLDLSQINDLTALVLVSLVDGEWATESTFWLPADGIEERSRRDRVPYDVWAKAGFIELTPGKSIEYGFVAEYIAKLFQTRSIAKIAFDRYNMRYLRPWLVKAGLSDAFIDEHFIEFGQGFVSMSPALRTLESLLLNAKLRHGMHPVLTMCAANAVVKTNEAGDRKLDKKRSRGRIDGMVALAMATEAANTHLAADEAQKFKPEWLEFWTTPPEGGNRYILCSPANEKKKQSEYSAIWVLELRSDRSYYAVDFVRDKLNLADRTDLLFKLHREYQPLRVGFDEYGLQADRAHIEDRQSRENYRFALTPIGGTLSQSERIRRLMPIFEAGRFVLPQKLPKQLADGTTVDMTDVFVREEYTPFPLGFHADMLELASLILDVRADFPAAKTWKAPTVFPSDF